MGKGKKSKSGKRRKPMDPQTVRRLQRSGFHLTAALLLIGGLAVAMHFDKKYVARKITAIKEPPKLVLKNRPVWMSDFLADQIAASAQPSGTHSAFDHQLLVDTVDLLNSNPWIRKVNQVRREYGTRPGDTIEVDCDYRAPVALVHWKDYFWMVDGDGIKLPEAFNTSDVRRIETGSNGKMNIRVIDGVRQPPPASGAKWSGEDLQAGLALVKLLFGKPYAEEIEKVDVSNFDGRRDGKASQLVLWTKYGTSIRWGRPLKAEDDFFVEVSPQRKLEYLEAIWKDKGRVDGNYQWVDVRFDTVTIPSSAEAAKHTEAASGATARSQ
jgi:hypothetical protein